MSDKIERLYAAAVTGKIAVGYALLAAIVGLILAVKVALTGHLFVDIAAWTLAVPAILSAIVLAAGRLRRRVVGERGERIWNLTDALIGQALFVLGALLLVGFLPRVRHGGDGVDLLLLVLGGSFAFAALSMLVRYALTP